MHYTAKYRLVDSSGSEVASFEGDPVAVTYWANEAAPGSIQVAANNEWLALTDKDGKHHVVSVQGGVVWQDEVGESRELKASELPTVIRDFHRRCLFAQ